MACVNLRTSSCSTEAPDAEADVLEKTMSGDAMQKVMSMASNASSVKDEFLSKELFGSKGKPQPQVWFMFPFANFLVPFFEP